MSIETLRLRLPCPSSRDDLPSPLVPIDTTLRLIICTRLSRRPWPCGLASAPERVEVAEAMLLVMAWLLPEAARYSPPARFATELLRLAPSDTVRLNDPPVLSTALAAAIPKLGCAPSTSLFPGGGGRLRSYVIGGPS